MSSDEISSSEDSSDEGGGVWRPSYEPEPEPEPVHFFSPPEPSQRCEQPFASWHSCVVQPPSGGARLPPAAPRRPPAAAARGRREGEQPPGWERRKGAADEWLYVNTVTGAVSVSPPDPGRASPQPRGGAERRTMSPAAQAYSAGANRARALATAGAIANHRKGLRDGDPEAMAVHPDDLQSRLGRMDPDQKNLGMLHALGHELGKLAEDADAMFSRLDAEVDSTLDRIRVTRERVSRLRGCAPYISQLWARTPEPLLLYEQPEPADGRTEVREVLSAELPSANFFQPDSLPPSWRERRERCEPAPAFTAMSPFVAPVFGKGKFEQAVLDAEGQFNSGLRFYHNPDCFINFFYQNVVAEGKAARAEKKARRAKRKEQRKRILRKIRLMMMLGAGTLARELEEVLQQDERRESLEAQRREGSAVGGEPYSLCLPSGVEEPGMHFLVLPAVPGLLPERLVVDAIEPKGAAGRAGIAVGDELLKVELADKEARAAGYTGPALALNCRVRLSEGMRAAELLEELPLLWGELMRCGKQYSSLWRWTFAHHGLSAEERDATAAASPLLVEMRQRAQAQPPPRSAPPLLDRRWGAAAADGNGLMGAREAHTLTLQEWRRLGGWERLRAVDRFNRGDNPMKGVKRTAAEVRAAEERPPGAFVLPHRGALHATVGAHGGTGIGTSESSLAAAYGMGLLTHAQASAVAEALASGRPLPAPPVPMDSSTTPAPRVCVTQSWRSEQEGYLTLEQGDVIIVTDQPEEEWWTGYHEGAALGNRVLGDFPSTVVERLPGFAAALSARQGGAAGGSTQVRTGLDVEVVTVASVVVDVDEEPGEVICYCRALRDYSAGEGFVGYLDLRVSFTVLGCTTVRV